MVRSIEELLAGIKEQRDLLNATAGEADRLGEAPKSLVALMRKLRVPMVKAPAVAGGDNLSLSEQMRYFSALSYENATAGWTGFNHAGASAAAASKLAEPGFQEVFGDNSCPFFAAVSAPTGRFRRQGDGVVVNGLWKFASGCLHADWVLLMAADEADPANMRMVVASINEVRREGEWNVMALKGTGSINIVGEDLYVPDYRLIDLMGVPLRGGPEYSLRYFVYVAGENLGFTLGVAERFLDEAKAQARTKARGPGNTLAERGAFAYEIGKAQTQLASVRALGLITFDQAWERCRRNGELTPAEENKVAATTAYGTELCAEVVSHIFHFMGASAIFDESILQRCFRDVHGSAQHLVASNEAYDLRGGDLMRGGDWPQSQ